MWIGVILYLCILFISYTKKSFVQERSRYDEEFFKKYLRNAKSSLISTLYVLLWEIVQNHESSIYDFDSVNYQLKPIIIQLWYMIFHDETRGAIAINKLGHREDKCSVWIIYKMQSAIYIFIQQTADSVFKVISAGSGQKFGKP